MNNKLTKNQKILLNGIMFSGYLYFGSLFFWWPLVVVCAIVLIPSVLLTVFYLAGMVIIAFIPNFQHTKLVTGIDKYYRHAGLEVLAGVSEVNRKVLRFIFCVLLLVALLISIVIALSLHLYHSA